MASFSLEKTEIDGLVVINNFFVGDNRGGFTKSFEKNIYSEFGVEFSLNETFTSISAKNILRGLHFQIHNPQAKLVTVVQGKVWDVAVDLRPNSLTYKKWVGIELSAENHKSFYIPKGFAHGFVALEDNSIMLYQCDGAYDKETDTGIRFDDATIAIDWPVNLSDVVCSSRDMQLMSFEEYEKNPMEVKV